MMPSWSIDRFENCAAVCDGVDGGMAGSLIDARVEMIEGALVGEPCSSEGGRLVGDDEEEASCCCDGDD